MNTPACVCPTIIDSDTFFGGYDTSYLQTSRTKFSHIDGRPRFAKRSIDDVKQVEIAAIDPDLLIGAVAPVPDGICWQVPNQPIELDAPRVN